MDVKDSEGISKVAFARLLELIRDMGWSEAYTIKVFTKEIAEPLGQGEKSIKQWFDREMIPTHHVFNVALILGVYPSWLAGLPTVTKKESIDENGLYARVMAGRTSSRAAPSKK